MAENADVSDQVRYLLLAVAVGILGLLVGGLLTVTALVALGAAGVDTGPSVIIVVSLLLTQGVGMGGVALAYLKYRNLSLDFFNPQIPTLREWIWTGAGYVLALVLVFVAAMIVFIGAGAPQTQNQATELAVQQPAILLFMIPGSFLLIGPGEELLFRGVVQGTLREVFGSVVAITLASAIFAAVHVVALTGSPTARLAGIAVLFVPSLVLGVAYERTGNIVVPSLIHGLYNATLFTLLYVTLQFGGAP